MEQIIHSQNLPETTNLKLSRSVNIFGGVLLIISLVPALFINCTQLYKPFAYTVLGLAMTLSFICVVLLFTRKNKKLLYCIIGWCIAAGVVSFFISQFVVNCNDAFQA